MDVCYHRLTPTSIILGSGAVPPLHIFQSVILDPFLCCSDMLLHSSFRLKMITTSLIALYVRSGNLKLWPSTWGDFIWVSLSLFKFLYNRASQSFLYSPDQTTERSCTFVISNFITFKGLPGHREVEVKYVDFGNTAKITLKDMRKIKNEFLDPPEKVIYLFQTLQLEY